MAELSDQTESNIPKEWFKGTDGADCDNECLSKFGETEYALVSSSTNENLFLEDDTKELKYVLQN